MDLTDIAAIKKFSRRHGIFPDPDAGQHFLVNRAALDAMVASADLSSSDTILEVGAGLGTLTVELARRARRVIAVEVDTTLYAAAKEILARHKNVTLIQGNFFHLTADQLPLTTDAYKLVANLPYHITGRFFRKIFSTEPRPGRIVVMVQAEVAERITAPPGKMSLIAVLCQLYAEPRLVCKASRHDFWPAPAVDSAVLRLDVRSPAQLAAHLGPPPPALTAEAVLQTAKIGFGSRRKTLRNNFMVHPLNSSPSAKHRQHILAAFTHLGLGPNARAQELSITQWITLAKKLKNCCS